MAFKKGVKYITIPKFIIQKFNLKQCPYVELPDYVRKSGICLKNLQGITLKVDSLTQLKEVLTYFRAAGQVCLQLVYKHMIIEQEKKEVEKKDEAVLFPSYTAFIPNKMRPRRKIDGQNRSMAGGSAVVNVRQTGSLTSSNEHLSLRFGISKTIMWNRRGKERICSQDGDGFSNDFYRHLIMRTRRRNSFVKNYSYLKNLFAKN